jgi:hypothetical protein
MSFYIILVVDRTLIPRIYGIPQCYHLNRGIVPSLFDLRSTCDNTLVCVCVCVCVCVGVWLAGTNLAMERRFGQLAGTKLALERQGVRFFPRSEAPTEKLMAFHKL